MKFEKDAYIKVAYFSIFSILYSFISSKLIEYLKIDENNIGGITFKSIIQEIFISLVIGPIIETFIFQFGIYTIIFYFKNDIQKYLLKKEFQFLGFYILLSSILFAISHNYSIYYILLMIIPGAVLSYAFYFLKKNFTYPILYTFLIHFIHNLFIFITEKI